MTKSTLAQQVAAAQAELAQWTPAVRAALGISGQPVAPELTDDHPHADLIHELRQFAQAYPEDIFTPLTDAEREGNDLIITKASAGMGRHCAKWFIKAADALESASPVAPVSALSDETLLKLALRTLWIAYVWNDHNFGPAHKEARKTCQNAGIKTFDQANAWIESKLALLAASPTVSPVEPTFQQRVQPWMMACFGAEISADSRERNHRFFEEAGELVQACGMPREEAHLLVDYVYDRQVGEKQQEVGGVMVTLAALCLAQGIDMHEAGEIELARIWTKVEAIRAKQAAKPKNSPLPVAVSPVEPVSEDKLDPVAETLMRAGESRADAIRMAAEGRAAVVSENDEPDAYLWRMAGPWEICLAPMTDADRAAATKIVPIWFADRPDRARISRHGKNA